MKIQPSASRTEILLRCSRAFSVEAPPSEERETSEAAEYGTAFHAVLEARISPSIRVVEMPPQWAEELTAHANAAEDALRRWLAGDNPFAERWTVESTERHLALEVIPHASGQPLVHAERAAFDEAAHMYEMEEGAIGATPDLTAVSAAVGAYRRIVIDYKTGDHGDFSRPSRHPQMRTLALATGATHVGILHTPRGNFEPVLYAEEFTERDRFEHASALLKALERLGDGSMTPGPWCRYCPVRGDCPTQVGELLQRTTALARHAIRLPMLPPEEINLGRLHRFLGEFDKLATRMRSEIKSRVAAGEVIERDDGKTLRLEQRRVESLSKGSILRALGKTAGEAEIERLRGLGCVEIQEREECHAR